MQPAGLCHGQQFVVWNAAPQEERQPRGELVVVDADVDPRARARVPGVPLGAKHELRVGQDPAQRRTRCRSRSSLAAARRDRAPAGDRARARDRATVGPRGQRGKDRLRARQLVRAAGRTAGEDAAATGRVAGTGGVEGAGDGQARDVRQPGVVAGIERGPQERLEPRAALRRRPLDEGRGHRVRPGSDRHARGQPRRRAP